MTQEATIQCGTYKFEWGKTITEMDDSTHLLNDLAALRSTLASEGYILLRNQIPTKLIDDSLRRIRKSLHETWDCLDITNKCANLDDLYIKKGCSGLLLTGYKPITHNESVLSLLHCDELINLMNAILDGEAVTFDTKWLRVKGSGEFTDQHSDYYRFSECESAELLVTVWMPLMNVPICRGPLAVCPKSHLLDFQTATKYERKYDDTDEELPSDFSAFNKTAQWKVTNFNAGDVLIFDIRTVHAALVNKTNTFRISIDTRWQPMDSIAFWNDSFIRFHKNNMMDCTCSDIEDIDDINHGTNDSDTAFL